MKKVFLLIIPLLLLSSCDRFEHEPFKSAVLEGDMLSFFSALQSASADSLDGVMEWYSSGYLQDKQNKADIEHQYANYYLEYGNDLQLLGNLEDYWKSGRVLWELQGTLPDRSTFLIAQQEDYLHKEGDHYFFIGNQVSPPELDPSKPVILVQYFTATTCGNCPAASTKLSEMHDEYGEQMVILEYVADSDPGSVYFPESIYYGGAQPSAIFQGQYRVVGAGAANLQEYEARYQLAVSEELQFRFTSLDINVSGNTIIADVSWETTGILTGDDLMLRSVVLEEDPDMHYIFSPAVYFENRVIAGMETNFEESITNTELTLEVSIDLPPKFSVVVWLQNHPETWTGDTGQVYNVIKKVVGE
ncbi:MAG: hypothetical protein K9N06_03725 [Candidatus Cloacimonetes bacterium]|nr:hypothetical protein [Candidatus Cloacimonadota bacterium]